MFLPTTLLTSIALMFMCRSLSQMVRVSPSAAVGAHVACDRRVMPLDDMSHAPEPRNHPCIILLGGREQAVGGIQETL